MSLIFAFWLGGLLACTPSDDCDAMCGAALERFTSCLAEGGQSWGDGVGYADEADYEDWCSTWTWEQRQLGEAAACSEKLVAFEDGDCNGYYAAWSSP